MQASERKLPYPTKPLAIGTSFIEEYIIPEGDKQKILKQLYPFGSVPTLDQEKYDLHADKTFIVRDFKVVRENGENHLVSPYYAEGGGTVIDWMNS